MKQYLDLIVVTVVLTFGAAMLTYVDASGDRKSGSREGEPQNRQHKDAAGQVTDPQTTREKAVEKEPSRHLGAGEGTSSVIGAEKMPSDSGLST